VFINHVVFRVNTGRDPTFADLATSVRDTVWDAFANQDVPFEEVVKEVAGKNGPAADAFYVINYICQRGIRACLDLRFRICRFADVDDAVEVSRRTV